MTDPRSPTPAAAPTPAGATPPREAVIFEPEGVVTDTAALHATAWKTLLNEVLDDDRVPGAGSHPPFDAAADHRRYVDGRAREDGVCTFLAARGIEIPLGTPDDPAGSWTVHGLAGRKKAIYLDMLASAGVRAYSGTVELIDMLRAGGVRLALVTASRNASPSLTAAGLDGSVRRRR